MAPDIGRLYEIHGPAVYRYVRSRGFDEAAAADIAQETFLAAWRERDRFAGDSRPLTWLIGIARHKLADETRRRERSRPLSGEMREASGGGGLGGIEGVIGLKDALRSLDPGQRELLALVTVAGLTCAETARALGVPEGTVKSRLSRIRAALRERMEGDPK